MSKMQNNNVAYVEQEGAGHAPTLYSGNITPTVMHEFEDACVGFFDHKDVPLNKQVKKIMPGMKDS